MELWNQGPVVGSDANGPNHARVLQLHGSVQDPLGWAFGEVPQKEDVGVVGAQLLQAPLQEGLGEKGRVGIAQHGGDRTQSGYERGGDVGESTGAPPNHPGLEGEEHRPLSLDQK